MEIPLLWNLWDLFLSHIFRFSFSVIQGAGWRGEGCTPFVWNCTPRVWSSPRILSWAPRVWSEICNGNVIGLYFLGYTSFRRKIEKGASQCHAELNHFYVCLKIKYNLIISAAPPKINLRFFHMQNDFLSCAPRVYKTYKKFFTLNPRFIISRVNNNVLENGALLFGKRI